MLPHDLHREDRLAPQAKQPCPLLVLGRFPFVSCMANWAAESGSTSLGPEIVSLAEQAASTSASGRRWQQIYREAIRDPHELCRLLQLPASVAATAELVALHFPLRVPHGYLQRIEPGNPADPLLRQVLPLDAETLTPPGFMIDPVGDSQATLKPGLLHKYATRALMVTTGACAVHCRYCFRRHFPYHEVPKGVAAWEEALQAIAETPALDEILLSGGDPLSLADHVLRQLVDRLAAIPHIQRLRVHTRLPIVIPERVTDELLDWLTATRLQPVMVVHVNHPNELDDAVATALGRLATAGVTLLNQAVLLRGVNDNLPALVQLSNRLFACRVLPYYLHQLDPVQGAAHFEVSIDRGHQLMAELRAQLPGYLVPRYVQEIAGAPNKVVLA